MPGFHHNLFGIGDLFMYTERSYSQKQWSPYLKINRSQSSQAGGTTTVPNYGKYPWYLMKMTPLGVIELNIPHWECTAHMNSLLLQPWCGIFMHIQGTQWYPHGWMLSKQVIICPGQDSHTIMRHGTTPHQTKPSRVTWWWPGRASGLQESCSTNLQKPQIQYQLRSRQTRLHKSQGHNQTNYTYMKCTQASCTRMIMVDFICVKVVATSILWLPIILPM